MATSIAPAGAPATRYDVAGRLVRQLFDAWDPPGLRVRMWDGRDERGRQVGSGVYVVRLTWSGGVATRCVTLVR